MPRFEVGDICTCNDDHECFFVPGSVVVVTTIDTNGNKSCVSVKLLFGAYKDVPPFPLQTNTDKTGAVYCFTTELEILHKHT